MARGFVFFCEFDGLQNDSEKRIPSCVSHLSNGTVRIVCCGLTLLNLHTNDKRR